MSVTKIELTSTKSIYLIIQERERKSIFLRVVQLQNETNRPAIETVLHFTHRVRISIKIYHYKFHKNPPLTVISHSFTTKNLICPYPGNLSYVILTVPVIISIRSLRS